MGHCDYFETSTSFIVFGTALKEDPLPIAHEFACTAKV